MASVGISISIRCVGAMAHKVKQHGRWVPWSCWQEWRQVKSDLYDPHDVSRNQRGLAWVSCWRCKGRVPVAVNATAELIQITMQTGTDTSPYVQRLTYSMAIVRLVNGVAGALQKGVYAKSVASLAESVGLPRILVDIRHEATHNVLPSLSTLRIAADQALTWLKQNYWELQETELLDTENKIKEALEKLLLSCQQSNHKNSNNTFDALDHAAEDSKGDTVEISKKSRATTLKELAELIPTSKASNLVLHLLDLILSKPFSASQSGAWHMLLNKLFKQWPHLPPALLAECCNRLKAEMSRTTLKEKPNEDVLMDFIRWFIKADTYMAADLSMKKIVYEMVVHCISLSKEMLNQSEKVDSFRQACQQCLALSNGMQNTRLQARSKVIQNLSGENEEGPTLFFESNEGGARDVIDDRSCNEKIEERIQELHNKKHFKVSGEKRWRRCTFWSSCALGNLPCEIDPNGKLPFTFGSPEANTVQPRQNGAHHVDPHPTFHEGVPPQACISEARIEEPLEEVESLLGPPKKIAKLDQVNIMIL